MTVKNVFKLAQIQTTIGTFLTTLLGIVYAWYNYETFHPLLSSLTILVVILFLLGVNVRDHFVDYEVAFKKGSPLAQEMVIGKENLQLKDVRLIYVVFWITSALIGVYIVTQTTLFALYAALICFLIGILYAAGPLPISSTRYGEVVTGIAMGFGVFFSTFYVNAYAALSFNGLTIVQILLASTPTTIVAINIVLANNICDVEEDVEDNRFTLPYHIGIEKSLLLFKYLYYLAYLTIPVSVMLGIFPKLVLLSLLSFPAVQRNIQLFMGDQDKERGLRLASLNAVIITAAILLSFLMGIWFGL